MFIKTVLIVTFFSLFISASPHSKPKTQNAKLEGPLSISQFRMSDFGFRQLPEIRNPKSEIKMDSCIDLVFDTVKIIKMTEKYIEIEFSIVNRGTLSAPLFGRKNTKEDNVAVHFYFSGTNRMTRGAIFADGIYLTKGLKETKGWLTPNEVYTERIKLSLKKRISFYGVILLQLDAFDILRQECDETNNVQAITPRWY